jgi:hypothetical protein
MNTKFKVFGELFIEFFEVFSIFTYFSNKFKAFFGNVLLDNLKDFILLEELS